MTSLLYGQIIRETVSCYSLGSVAPLYSTTEYAVLSVECIILDFTFNA